MKIVIVATLQDSYENFIPYINNMIMPLNTLAYLIFTIYSVIVRCVLLLIVFYSFEEIKLLRPNQVP